MAKKTKGKGEIERRSRAAGSKNPAPRGRTLAENSANHVENVATGKAEAKAPPDFLAFKEGLYYPFIDISNEGWLKSALLYWDSLTTIVPEGFRSHRENPTSRELAAASFLNPEFVAPGMPELEQAADDSIAFLDSAEGLSLVATSRRPHSRDPDVEWHPEAIHSRKLLDRVVNDLRSRGLEIAPHGDWLRVPGWFARYYMTVLATRLARSRGQSIVTDDPAVEPLANRAVRGDSEKVPAAIAQGLLATMVLQTVHVNESTPVSKLLEFRDKHSRELGAFRTSIRELLKPLNGEIDLIPLQKHLATVFTDQINPSLDAIRGRLNDNRIACGYNNLQASTLFSAGATALSTALGTLALGPFGLFAGVGVSILLSLGNYQIQRRDILRGSPYSYVLQAEQHFGKRSLR
jgi:hypothetical protein